MKKSFMRTCAISVRGETRHEAFDVDIDFDAIVQKLGPRAITNKSGTKQIDGALVVATRKRKS